MPEKGRYPTPRAVRERSEEQDAKSDRTRRQRHRRAVPAGSLTGRSPGPRRGGPRGGGHRARGRQPERDARVHSERRLRHRQPRLQLRGERRRGGPPGRLLRRHVLRVHDGQRPREPHRRAGVVVPQFRLRALHAQLLWIDGVAESLALGTSEHPDVAGSLPVRRSLGDVLRRGPVGARVGQRVRLPRRGDGGLHLPDGRRSSATCRTAPIECQPTGSIDPEPYVDPSTGVAYLVWKQNDGGSSAPAYIWAQQLNSAGTGFAPGSDARASCSPTTPSRTPGRRPWRTRRWRQPAVASTWRSRRASTRAPATPRGSPPAAGRSARADRRARCSPPTARCSVRAAGRSSPTPRGTGGSTTRRGRAGRAGCTSYACGAARQLFVAPINLPSGNGRGPLQRAGLAVRRTTWSPRTAASSTTATSRSAGPKGGRLAQQARGRDGCHP